MGTFKRSGPHSAVDTPQRFRVDDVKRAANPIWTRPLSDQVAARFARKVILLPYPEKAVVHVTGDSHAHIASSRERQPFAIPVSRIHPLIEAVHLAFGQHRPLTLSPDSIWLTIAQGFSHHIAENAEALRHSLVRHSNKVELVEEIDGVNLEECRKAIAGFSSQIREASDPVLHETLICDFSTTTPDVHTASEIVLMDCYASYFTYVFDCICGIPTVSLMGTLEDWRRIRARVEVLATYELDWWIDRVRPILDQFVATAEGKPDLAFWQSIYKPRSTYGTETITGWIADLFPYLDNPLAKSHADQRRRSHVFNHERRDWTLPKGEGVGTGPFDAGAAFGVAPAQFPSGLASVPIELRFSDHPNNGTQLDLVGGFLAVEQDDDLSLSPVISWAITERAPAEPVILT